MKKLAVLLALFGIIAFGTTSALADQITISVNHKGSAIFTDTNSGITFNFTGNTGACGHSDCVSGYALFEPAITVIPYTMWLTGGPLKLTPTTEPDSFSVANNHGPTQLHLEVKLGASNDLVAALVLTEVDASDMSPHFIGTGTPTTSTGLFASIFPVGMPSQFNLTVDANAILSNMRVGQSTKAKISDGEFDSPVPEPGTLALMGTGVLGLAGLLRRKIM